jgi:predicted DNA-binding transcriptional regulator AlpA
LGYGNIAPDHLEYLEVSDNKNFQHQSAGLLNVKEAAYQLGVSMSLLNKWRVVGRGPAFVKLGRLVRYRLSDIDDWAASNMFGSTSQY